MNFQKRAMYSIKHSFIPVLFFVMAIESVHADSFHSFSESSEQFDEHAAFAVDQSDESFDSDQADAEQDTSESTPYLNRGTQDTAAYAAGFRYNVHTGTRVQAKIMHKAVVSSIQLESDLHAPYTDFSLKNFGIGMYPCTFAQEMYPQSAIPDLFIAAGGISFSPWLNKINGFSRIRPRYTGIRFPHRNFLKLRQGSKELYYGIELSGTAWTTAAFSSFDIKEEGIQCGIFGQWQEKKILNSAIDFSIQHISSMIPVKKEEPLLNQHAVSSHHALLGLGCTIIHPYHSFETIGVCTFLADKGLTGFGRAEYNLFYRYLGINTGISYTAPRFISWTGRTKKEGLYLFVQPYTKVGICSLYGLYSFHTYYKNETPIPFHECGFAVNVKHPIVQWKGEWVFANHLHTLKQQVTLISSPSWFSSYAWFEQASLISQLYLHHTAKHVSIKKYNIQALLSCSFLEGWSYGLQAGIHEQPKKEKRSAQEAEPHYGRNPCYTGKMFTKVKKRTADAVHTIRIDLGGKTSEPYFDFSIAYTVQTH